MEPQPQHAAGQQQFGPTWVSAEGSQQSCTSWHAAAASPQTVLASGRPARESTTNDIVMPRSTFCVTTLTSEHFILLIHGHKHPGG